MEAPFTLVCLPEHILIKILSYMTYGEMSDLRLVCQTFNRLCGRELTRAFIRVDRVHSQLQKSIKSQLPRKESERRNHPLSRFVDILSAMETRLSLLSMTYTKYIDLDLCCFIPGKVLDEMTRLLHRLQDTESQPPRSYDLLQSLRDFSTMAMEHFEENVAPLLKAQMNDSFFASTASTPLSSLTSSIVSSPFTPTMDMSVSAVMPPLLDLSSWAVSGAVPLVSTPWRRTPLKLDVQRVQNQMQIHSAAIATVTKEYREQKVKIGEHNRIIAEQERKIQEQSRQILELTAHIQSQEKSIELMAKHLSAVTGKEIKLPEIKPWEQSSVAARVAGFPTPYQDSSSSEEGYAHSDNLRLTELDNRAHFHQMLAEFGGDGCISRDARLHISLNSLSLPKNEDFSPSLASPCFPMLHYPHSPHTSLFSKPPLLSATGLTSELVGFQPMHYSVNKLCPELDSACPASRLMTQSSLLITAILSKHNLSPLCLMEPRDSVVIEPNDPRTAVLESLSKAQQQLHRLLEEHQGCTTCAEDGQAAANVSVSTFSASNINPVPSTSQSTTASGSRADMLSSVPSGNQGLYHRCQELFAKLITLKNEGAKEEMIHLESTPLKNPPVSEKDGSQEPIHVKGKGKIPLKRSCSVTKSESTKAPEETETYLRSRKRRKR